MRYEEEISETSGINCLSIELAKITERIPIARIKFATGPASITQALCHLGLLSKVLALCSRVKFLMNSESSSLTFSVWKAT